MKKIIRFLIYMLMHIMIAVCFIDTKNDDKLYAGLIAFVCFVILIIIRADRKTYKKNIMNRTYFYLLFSIFLSFVSIADKSSISYDWFNVYGFKIWLNILSLILISKTIYGYVLICRHQRKNPRNDIKAKSLLSKKKGYYSPISK